MKNNIKEMLYMVERQIMEITISLLVCLGFMKLFTGSFESWSWYFPFQIIGISVPTGLCAFIFYNKKELNRKQFLIRVVIHFFALISIVLLEGYIFSWWTNIGGMLLVLLIFACVYASVWIASMFGDKKDSEKINKALKNRNSSKDNE